MSRALAFMAAGALLLASPASAQYTPAPPPPTSGQPAYAQPAYSLQPELRKNTVRLSAGVAFVGAGYFCSYYGYYPGFYGSCGYGYSTTQPNINLDFDLGLKGPAAISFGGNVFWGSYNAISNTVWEPHVDYLYRSGDSRQPIVGRFRIGAGMYIASVSGTSAAGKSFSDTKLGGALRVGGGASLLNDKVVGVGLDAVFEGGSIGGYYVSTIQLLVGPEIHF
jgi:hypothetical protein